MYAHLSTDLTATIIIPFSVLDLKSFGVSLMITRNVVCMNNGLQFLIIYDM